MRSRHLRLLLTGVAVALIGLGCSENVSRINAPPGSNLSGPAALITAPAGNVVPGDYIVVFRDAVTDVNQVTNDLHASLGIAPNYVYRYALKGFAAHLDPAALTALQRDTRVAWIEEDQWAHMVATQTNPPSWGLDRVDQHNLPLDHSYTYNQTGAGVDAYIIDTGIRFTHVDFGGRAVTGIDEITPGGDAHDGNGHGTHVSGTVGGTSYGLAKTIRLIAVRVLDNNGSGTYAQVIAGVDWVTGDHTTRPAVANMSLGGPQSTSLDQAVRNSIADGVTYCVAAGNNSANASGYSPADVAEAITVAATDVNDAWAYFSNYGSLIDFEGPGVSITSDWNTSDTAINTISGTSMATPHVTGAAALYLQAHPGSTPAQVASGLTAIATNGVITGVPAGTVNRLIYSLISGGGQPPPAPALLLPLNGALNVPRSPTLRWNASPGATSYEVQVSTNSSFSSTVFDRTGITGTSVIVPILGPLTTYYWRVNATNANGTSGWSSVWHFQTRSQF